MALQIGRNSEHGMLDGIKSRFGLGGKEDFYAEHGYDERYAEGVDEDDDYGDYGDVGAIDDGPRSTVTTRPVRPAKLVSFDDVRNSTQVSTRDAASRRALSAPVHRGARTMVDADDPLDPPAATSSQERSESLNALFTPTTPVATSTQAAPSTQAVPAISFDPYDAYAGGTAAKHDPTRSLTVIKPASYAEVERVAKSLKAGDVVVLGLRNTPDTLSKRILDFSFGVASALDASVDCVADKVFVVARGQGLTDAERTSLRNQGVL